MGVDDVQPAAASADVPVEFDGYMYSWHRNELSKIIDPTEPDIEPGVKKTLDAIDEDEREYQRWQRVIKKRRRRAKEYHENLRSAQPLASEVRKELKDFVEQEPVRAVLPGEAAMENIDKDVASPRDPSIDLMMEKLLLIEKAFLLLEKGAVSKGEFNVIKTKILGE